MRRSAAVLALLAAAVMMTVPASAGRAAAGVGGWLDLIVVCESDGLAVAVNLAVSEQHAYGQVGSYGLLQFGLPTWRAVARSAWAAGAEEVDWSHSPPHYAPADVQLRLGRRLWDGGLGWRHWRCCARMVGYPPALADERSEELCGRALR